MNWLFLTLAALCLGANIYNAVMTQELRAARSEFQQRQAYIAEGASYQQLNERVIKSLANMSASTNDDAIRQMLASEGVTFKVNTDQTPRPDAREGGKNE